MRINLLIIAIFLSLSVSSQDVSTTQKTLITKRTATWCPNCGTWGWSFAKAVEDLNDPNAVLIRAHYSGDLQSTVADELTENFDPVYQPEFYINETRQSVASSTWSEKVNDFKNIITENAANDADFSLELSGSHDENSFSAIANVEVLSAVSGEFYVGLYVLEDSVLNSQAGLGQDVSHNGVLRWALSGKSFGSEVLNGSADPGSSFSQELTLTLESEELVGRKFRLLAIVWEKLGEKYMVANLHAIALEKTSSTLISVEQIQEFNYINIGTETTYSFQLSKSYESANLSIHTMDGQLLRTESFHARAGANLVNSTLNNVVPQIVLVTISGNGELLLTEKVLLK